MVSAKIKDVEIPRQFLDYVVGSIGGEIRISGLIPLDHSAVKMLKDLPRDKDKFVPFECTDSRGTYLGGIGEVKEVELKDEPAGLRYSILLKKQ